MALLGIDYGTTNTVAVADDRGHYPVVPHVMRTSAGMISTDTFPSLMAFDLERGGLVFGAEAERALCRPGAERRFAAVRGLKRLLRDYCENRRVFQESVPGGLDPAAALAGFLSALKSSICASGLFPEGESLDAAITWPANANGAQRHATRKSFAAAGFNVAATLSEPAAAAIEFADRAARGNRSAARALHATVAVFDLGGGTFDASLVRIEGPEFTVLDTTGIERLGGDDFDTLLAGMFAEKMGIRLGDLSPFQTNLLLAHSRLQKECAGSGQVRTLTLEPADILLPSSGAVSVPASSFLGEAERMLKPAAAKLAEMISRARPDSLEAIYLVGGSSKLPAASKIVARRFPDTALIMTDKPFCAAAMGAAMRGAESVRMRDILARTFGVIRTVEGGARERFDPIFPAGTPLPERGAPPLTKEFVYAPQHNIGRLRYLECAAVSRDGMPSDGARPWSEAFFPYDPAIPMDAMIESEPVLLRNDLLDTRVRESYSCDSDGVITARITRCGDSQGRVFEIFRN